GAAEAFGSRPMRNVIEERLSGTPNHRDRICARVRSRAALDCVLVNIARSYDDVKERAIPSVDREWVTHLFAQQIAILPLRDEILHSTVAKLVRLLLNLGIASHR